EEPRQGPRGAAQPQAAASGAPAWAEAARTPLAALASPGAGARSSAFFEDLISFLEMHSLPGAYALVIAAHGIQDLSQLLTLDDAALDRVLVKCELDAVDEILLKDALQRVRPNPDGD
ncbi:unnamed protein product, partial [Prorocentrum cordatum]